MKLHSPLLLTAGALALLVSAPSLGQSTEQVSLNFERITAARTTDGVEPDEIDARNAAALTGVEPDEIDNRATQAHGATGQSRRRGATTLGDVQMNTNEPQAGLLLPAVQNVRATGEPPQPRTPVFIEIDDIPGEAADVSGDGTPDIITAPGAGSPRAARANPRRRD